MNPPVPRFLQQLAPGARAAAGVSAVLGPRYAPTTMREAVASESVASQSAAEARHAVIAPVPRGHPLDVAAVASVAAPPASQAEALDAATAPPLHAAPITPPDLVAPWVDAAVALTALRAATPVAVAVAEPTTHQVRQSADAVKPLLPARSTEAMPAAALRAPLRESTVAHHVAALRAAIVAPVVQVTIDRIDVRAAPASVAPHEPVRRRAAATTSLADYLRQPAPGTRP